MLDVNEVIEVEDKLNEVQIEGNKLDFAIQNALNEIEETKANLILENKRGVIIDSNLERIYTFIDIALDYKMKALKSNEEARELITSLVEKAREEAEAV